MSVLVKTSYLSHFVETDASFRIAICKNYGHVNLYIIRHWMPIYMYASLYVSCLSTIKQMWNVLVFCIKLSSQRKFGLQ